MPETKWESDSDGEFNTTPSSLRVPGSSLPRGSVFVTIPANTLTTRRVPKLADCFIAVTERPPFLRLRGGPGQFVKLEKRNIP